MKKFELIVGLIAIFGITLKILHIVGGSILTMLALTVLSVFYYALSFAFFNDIKLRNILKKESYKDTNAKRMVGAIGLGWTLSLIIMGGLFKLQLWVGASMQLLVGLVTLGLIFLVALFFYFRNKAEYYKRIFKRIIIYGGLGLILYLIPTTTFLNFYYANNPNYTEHPNFAEHYKKVLAEPDNLKLRDQLEQMKFELKQMKFEKWKQEQNGKNMENE